MRRRKSSAAVVIKEEGGRSSAVTVAIDVLCQRCCRKCSCSEETILSKGICLAESHRSVGLPASSCGVRPLVPSTA